MAYHDLHIRKIHDLEVLIEDCKKIDLSFKAIQNNAKFLNQFYIESRYPDDYVEFSGKDAKEAYAAAKNVKEFVLEKIKIHPFK